jgi:hypothetical protein
MQEELQAVSYKPQAVALWASVFPTGRLLAACSSQLAAFYLFLRNFKKG